MELQMIAYICFAGIPVLACMAISIFYLFTLVAMVDYSKQNGEWFLRRPILNSVFSMPFRSLRNFMELPFKKLEEVADKHELAKMEKAIESEDALEKKSAKLSAGKWEKISLFFDYFTFFAGEFALLLIMYLGLRYLLPSLYAEFASTMDGLQTLLLETNVFNIFDTIGMIISAVADFFRKMFSMIDLKSANWWAFVIIALITSMPIRVWSIVGEEPPSFKTFFSWLWDLIKHYWSSFFTTFFSLQIILAVVSFVAGLFVTNGAALTDIIIKVGLYFAGLYLIAFVVQAIVYSLDFVIALLSLPVRAISGSRKSNGI